MPDRPKPRWYHLTPDRLLLGLFLAVGVLLLSEWFSWFPFNEHKGWTVLIAIATVCGAVLFLLLWFVVSLSFRWRFQFSIRSLLVFVLVCAVVCSWFAVRMREARRQREVVEAIGEAGGAIGYDYYMLPGPFRPSKPSAPTWLIKMLGVDFFHDATVASCHVPDFGDENPDFGDENMVYLSELANVWWLDLGRTQVTDGGLVHLKGSTNLEELHLSRTQVTDAGLEHLKGLSNLYLLDLRETQVTDKGAKKLQQALPKCQIRH